MVTHQAIEKKKQNKKKQHQNSNEKTKSLWRPSNGESRKGKHKITYDFLNLGFNFDLEKDCKKMVGTREKKKPKVM